MTDVQDKGPDRTTHRSDGNAAGQSAALYYVPSGYSTQGRDLKGINAASEGFLKGLARYGNCQSLVAVNERASTYPAFQEAVRDANPSQSTAWASLAQPELLSPIGTLYLPGPGLAEYAWIRRRAGRTAYSLCGITHTTASQIALDAITSLHTSPTESWDALVCPSPSVRGMVKSVLDDHARYLSERFNSTNIPQPQLPVIPLGIDTDAFRPSPQVRAAFRNELGLTLNDVALLFIGRLNPLGKAHPVPLFLAAAAASRRATAPLTLILAGWFENPETERAYREAAADICPDVRLIVVDGREPHIRDGVWRAADIFLSPSDNYQETFGLTPVEAMAAGLPVVASAWDGYRDTIRHGLDGLLVPTWAPEPGAGSDLARAYGGRTVGYTDYVGVSSQAVAVDIQAMSDALVLLASSRGLRDQMGANGLERAHSKFDWRVVIPQYLALWSELKDRRSAAQLEPSTATPYPARPDPFAAFEGYTHLKINLDQQLDVGRTSPALIDYLWEGPLTRFATQNILPKETIAEIVGRLEFGPSTPADLARLSGLEPNARFIRSLGWLMKYGLVAASSQR